jgi:predicted dehydrogenase
MARRIRIGVIGTGWWATAVHLPAIAKRADAELVGVADTNLAKAREAATVFGSAHAVASHEELLQLEPDAVVVATPHDRHFEPARAALQLGIDVLVEKPMVLRVEHAEELVQIAAARRARLHVGYTFSYTRHVRRLKSAVAQGELGEIALATGLFATAMRTLYAQVARDADYTMAGALFAPESDTYANPERGGGQALAQLTHAVALLLHVLDVEPAEILGLTERHGYVVDVTNSIVFRTDAGALVSTTSTGMLGDQRRRVEEYRVFGSERHALLDTAVGTLFFVKGNEIREEDALAPGEIYPAGAPVDALIDSWLNDAEVLVSGELGLRVTTVLNALPFSALAPLPAQGGHDE